MDLEDMILIAVTQSQKNTHDMLSWILVQKLRIPKIQFAKHMKLEKKEDQSVDTLVLFRMGNKIPMEVLQNQSFQLRQMEGPSRDSPYRGSFP
jgi:hypothetical protein